MDHFMMLLIDFVIAKARLELMTSKLKYTDVLSLYYIQGL